MDKRIKTAAVFGCILLLCIGAFRRLEGERICGVSVKQQEELNAICAGLTLVEQPVNARELVLFNGAEIPYDENENCFYITQNVEREEFEGTLRAASGNAALYIQKNDVTKQQGMEAGVVWRLWIVTNERYTVCGVVFTGLPVISIDIDNIEMEIDTEIDAEIDMELEGGTETALELQYQTGVVSVWNPLDGELETVSDKSSQALVKLSESLETYTVKLRSDDGADNRKLSLLDMGKYDAWKLYAVSEKDDTYFRAALAYELYNEIVSEISLSRSVRLAELIVNGAYQGLYIATPRIDDDFFDTEEEITVAQVERTQAAGDFCFDGTAALDYFLFMQAAYAYGNIDGNFYVETDGEGVSFPLPGKVEYAFGIFPNRYQWMVYQSWGRLLAPRELAFLDEAALAYIEENAPSSWAALRENVLSGDALLEKQKAFAEDLLRSGFVARKGVSAEQYDACVGELAEYLTARMGVVDEAYER